MKKTIENIFTSTYDFNDWKQVLNTLFTSTEFYATPINSIDKTLAKHNIVNSINEFGNARLADGKLIRFYDVELEKGKSVSKNRVGLRNLIHTEINPGDTDALFAVYHNSDDKDWRLTFISKSIYWDENFSEQKEETHPKRFTYVLGVGETVKTAVSQFDSLVDKKITLESLIEAFSVEKLNKAFFKQYQSQYVKFWEYLANNEAYRKILLDTNKTKKEEQEKPIRDFTKKLLGRVVFLYFLQKKGWMGCPANSKKWEEGEKQFLQKLFENFEDQKHFHSQCLTELFFNTLNRKTEVFKYTGTRVPYLNGGLFEPDEPKTTANIDFPVSYFKELFDFFGQYNFTIDENSPDDHEVGIDPEMLGHIFENLLEDNKDKGTFYTPKEIVQYMTQESLIQYLQTHLGQHEEVERFIRFGDKGDEQARHNFIRDNATKIEDLLDKVKICDPAIGSGAFPMGMLHEIFKAKMALDWTLDRATVKKNIIQNSIYGVDLESGAIDIARLRFWLALVVDEEEPQPLPNLDYKIMQGDSLLESFEGMDLSTLHEGKSYDVKVIDTQINIFSGQEKKKVSQSLNFEQIEDLTKAYFSADTPEEKKELHQKIDKHILNHIHFTLEEHKAQLQKEAKKISKSIDTKVASLRTGEQKIKYQEESKEGKKLKEIQNQLNNITHKEIELFRLTQSTDRPFFLWHLFFKEVFEEGGFDIVIGNPPYIQIQSMGDYGSLLETVNYKTYAKTGDIYCVFYEKGVEVLKPKGTLSFITSNSWMKTKYGKGLRKFFIEESNPLKLLNFEDTKIFPSATVEVNIMILTKHNWLPPLKAVLINSDYKISIPISKYFNDNFFDVDVLDENGWIISNKESMVIKTLMDKNGKTLKDWEIKIYIGILNGFNEAFLITTELRNKFVENNPKSDDIIKPILRGRDLKKYNFEWNNLWLINSHNGLKAKGIDRVNIQKDYSEIYQHLLPYKEQLIVRQNKGDDWTNLRNCAYFQEFEKPKIIWGELSDIPKFAYDDSGMYAEATLFAMTGENLKYLLSILNSKAALWYFNQITTTSGMGTSRWKKYKIEQLPVPDVDRNTTNLFENLVDILLFLKKENNKIISTQSGISDNLISILIENVIDAAVFELYFKEHMIEREIDVIQYINHDFQELLGKEKFDILKVEEKITKILYLYKHWTYPDNIIRNRMKLFAIKSPEILKPILESTQ